MAQIDQDIVLKGHDQASPAINKVTQVLRDLEKGTIDAATAQRQLKDAQDKASKSTLSLTQYVKEQRAEQRQARFVMNEVKDALGGVAIGMSLLSLNSEGASRMTKDLTNNMNAAWAGFSAGDAIVSALATRFPALSGAMGGVITGGLAIVALFAQMAANSKAVEKEINNLVKSGIALDDELNNISKEDRLKKMNVELDRARQTLQAMDDMELDAYKTILAGGLPQFRLSPEKLKAANELKQQELNTRNFQKSILTAELDFQDKLDKIKRAATVLRQLALTDDIAKQRQILQKADRDEIQSYYRREKEKERININAAGNELSVLHSQKEKIAQDMQRMRIDYLKNPVSDWAMIFQSAKADSAEYIKAYNELLNGEGATSQLKIDGISGQERAKQREAEIIAWGKAQEEAAQKVYETQLKQKQKASPTLKNLNTEEQLNLSKLSAQQELEEIRRKNELNASIDLSAVAQVNLNLAQEEAINLLGVKNEQEKIEIETVSKTLQLINEYDEAIKKAGSDELARKAVEEDYATKLLAINNNAAYQRAALEQQTAEQIKAIRKDIVDATIEQDKRYQLAVTDNANERLTIEENAALAANERAKNEAVTKATEEGKSAEYINALTAKYERERVGIYKDFMGQRTANSKDALSTIQAMEIANMDEGLAKTKAILELQRQEELKAAEKEIADKDQLERAKAAIEAKYRKANADAETERLTTGLQTWAGYGSQLANIVGSYASNVNALEAVYSQNRMQNLQAETDAITKKYDDQLKNERLTTAQRKKIEKEKEKALEEQSKKESELKKQIWLQEKEAKRTQAIISTAQAITTTLASVPMPYAAILAAAAGALGMQQVAAINATEMPKFHTGGTVPQYVNAPPSREFPILVRGGETIRTEAQEAQLQAGQRQPVHMSFTFTSPVTEKEMVVRAIKQVLIDTGRDINSAIVNDQSTISLG